MQNGKPNSKSLRLEKKNILAAYKYIPRAFWSDTVTLQTILKKKNKIRISVALTVMIFSMTSNNLFRNGTLITNSYLEAPEHVSRKNFSKSDQQNFYSIIYEQWNEPNRINEFEQCTEPRSLS